jgi:hypothetical protein
MRRPWAQRLRVLVLVLIVAASVLLLIVAWRTSTGGLARALERDIRGRDSAHFTRPSHVGEPLPGTFGAQATGAWDALSSLQAASADVELCRAVRDSEQPVGSISASCEREARASAGALAALLLATHAAEAGPPAGLGTLDAPAPPGRPRSWSTLNYAGKLAALRVRQQLGEADAAAALDTCIDLEALARDASWGAGLAGRLPGAAVGEVAFRPCTAAIDAAPVEAKRRASMQLERVEAGTADLPTVLAEYALGVRAQAFAPWLPDAGSLPGQVPEWSRQNALGQPFDARGALLFGDAWHRIDARLRQVVEAARLPVEARIQRLDALSQGEHPGLNPLVRYALPQLGRVARTDARARAQLLLLRRALATDLFRAERGRWPTERELPPGLGSTAETPLRIEVTGEAATLIDPSVPRGELALTLHPDAGH